jgi:protein-S-isoprenylcysteine O-methyltransferase Ste14
MASPAEDKKLRIVSFAIHATRGLLRDQRARRNSMFVAVLVAVVLLFCGATFLYPLLRAHPLWFVLYWLACAWLTILAVLLAIFDLLVTRVQARAAERLLRSQLADTVTEDSQTDARHE